MERSKAKPITITVRPEVAKFAELMEEKLAENDHKGHWSEAPWDYHVERLQQEVEELHDALIQGNPRLIAEEAADVGNFAMFLADVAGGLGLEPVFRQRDEDCEPAWTCPETGLQGYVYSGGRRIERIEDGDSTDEPTDPFAGVNCRYKLFCLAHGAKSPTEMKRLGDGPGDPNFHLWLTGNMNEWKRLKGYKSDHVMTGDDHAEFDAWLEEQIRHLLKSEVQET